VSGTVTIEAWNANFNCSRLVSQRQEGTINNLSCNGTDNATQAIISAGPTPSPLSDDSLTQGAKAGIGVGVAVVALGSIIVIVWLILRFKIQRKGLSRRGSTPPPAEEEPGSRGTVQDKLGGQVHEAEGLMPVHQAEGRMIVQENPGNEIYELHTEQPGFVMLRTNLLLLLLLYLTPGSLYVTETPKPPEGH
jgi:hypothetical protein